jgi:hypothetical protein
LAASKKKTQSNTTSKRIQHIMKEILDDEFHEKDLIKKKDRLGFIYSMIMLIGGVLFFQNTTKSGAIASLIQLITASFLFQLSCILIPLIFSILSLLVRGKYDKSKITKLFLINKVETGFIIWCVIVILTVSGKFIQ